MKEQTLQANKSRIEWVDALKGFLILLVVIGHLTQSYEQANGLYTFIYTFHMPLFFWVSGYLSVNLARRNASQYVIKKVLTLLLPFISFAIIASFVKGVDSPVDFFLRFNKHGYWFLLTLFFFSLFLIGCCKVTHYVYRWLNIKCRTYIQDKKYILPVLELAFLGLIEVLFVLCCVYVPTVVQDLLQIKTFLLYWPYFVLGYIVSQYSIRIPDCIAGICGLAFFVVWYSSLEYGILTNEIAYQLSRFCATVFFFTVFLRVKSNWIINQLGFVGRETLCIYLIHYWFISGAGSWVFAHFGGTMVLQTVGFVVISIIIAMVCIVIKRVICKSSLLGLLLFGQR